MYVGTGSAESTVRAENVQEIRSSPHSDKRWDDSYDPGMARAEDAARRADLAAGDVRAEAVRAQRLIDAFLVSAQQLGLSPQPLEARLLSGHKVRTDKAGWYLRRDRSVAIGADGGYYQLLVPGGLRERLRGVRLRPTPPPLVIGRGGKDGENGPLQDFLDRLLKS